MSDERDRQIRAPGWRRWLSWSNLFVLAVMIWAAPRLLPHVGAALGVHSGQALAPIGVVSLRPAINRVLADRGL